MIARRSEVPQLAEVWFTKEPLTRVPRASPFPSLARGFGERHRLQRPPFFFFTALLLSAHSCNGVLRKRLRILPFWHTCMRVHSYYRELQPSILLLPVRSSISYSNLFLLGTVPFLCAKAAVQVEACYTYLKKLG